jgi:ketosteroid isomerase-like protein
MRRSEMGRPNQERAKRASRLAARWRRGAVAAAVLAVAFVLAGPASLRASAPAQKHQKQAKTDKGDTGGTGIVSPVPLPDAEAIDLLVSRMLGAWQVGNVDLLHKCYADDVVVVSGAWQPPLIGWENYLRAYQAQRAAIRDGLLERTNSYTKVLGDTAWMTYQWRFTGEVEGRATVTYGHTTLVLQKRAGSWLIVLNHTSEATPPPRRSSTPSVPPAAKPVNPPPPGASN